LKKVLPCGNDELFLSSIIPEKGYGLSQKSQWQNHAKDNSTQNIMEAISGIRRIYPNTQIEIAANFPPPIKKNEAFGSLVVTFFGFF
jgi:hypothetical protein